MRTRARCLKLETGGSGFEPPATSPQSPIHHD